MSSRWVAVYLETHCNIGSKRAFPTSILDRWHNCLLRYLSCTQHTALGKNCEFILTVKMETRHPIEGPTGQKYTAICNHCRVMTAWSCKTWKFCKQVLLFWKKDRTQTVATVRIVPKICQGQPPHLAHTVPCFIQIGSLSVELLPNAWRSFLSHKVFTTSALQAYNTWPL